MRYLIFLFDFVSGNTKEVKREVLHVNHVRLAQSNTPSLSTLVSGKMSPKEMVNPGGGINLKASLGSLQPSAVAPGSVNVGPGTTLTAVSVTTATTTVKSVSSLSPSSMASSMSVSVTSSSKQEAPSVSTLSGDHANDLEGKYLKSSARLL